MNPRLDGYINPDNLESFPLHVPKSSMTLIDIFARRNADKINDDLIN